MFQQDSSINIKNAFTLIHAHIKKGDQNVVTIYLFSSLTVVVICHIFTTKRRTECSGFDVL